MIRFTYPSLKTIGPSCEIPFLGSSLLFSNNNLLFNLSLHMKNYYLSVICQYLICQNLLYPWEILHFSGNKFDCCPQKQSCVEHNVFVWTIIGKILGLSTTVALKQNSINYAPKYSPRNKAYMRTDIFLTCKDQFVIECLISLGPITWRFLLEKIRWPKRFAFPVLTHAFSWIGL